MSFSSRKSVRSAVEPVHAAPADHEQRQHGGDLHHAVDRHPFVDAVDILGMGAIAGGRGGAVEIAKARIGGAGKRRIRSEARRAGTEWVSRCRAGWAAYVKKQKREK